MHSPWSHPITAVGMEISYAFDISVIDCLVMGLPHTTTVTVFSFVELNYRCLAPPQIVGWRER